jgi:hypothetical protein
MGDKGIRRSASLTGDPLQDIHAERQLDLRFVDFTHPLHWDLDLFLE